QFSGDTPVEISRGFEPPTITAASIISANASSRTTQTAFTSGPVCTLKQRRSQDTGFGQRTARLNLGRFIGLRSPSLSGSSGRASAADERSGIDLTAASNS